MAKKYWLMKSEPDSFSIDDLSKTKSEPWDGIRNYQARNFMRDDMKKGDLILFYHSNEKPPGVVGIAEVCSEAYPDHTAFDKRAEYYDPKSDPANPRWIMVDIKFKKKLKRMVELQELKNKVELRDMRVIQKGCRLSISPVSKKEYEVILRMSES